jgi:hypothetical protein
MATREPSGAPRAHDPSFAIVTPSFRLDFEQCRLLVESVERNVAPHVRHYVVVDRRDRAQFEALRSSRVDVMCVEDVLPWWLQRVPFARRWWLSFRGRPISNWMLQQMVKLATPAVVHADVLLFTDSDCFFVRPFDPRTFVQGGNVPLFREYSEDVNKDFNTRWKQIAAGLLALPGEVDRKTSYVGNLVPWRRENVLALHRHLETVSGRDWMQALTRVRVMSEYVIYGMFVEYVLGAEQAGHYFDSTVTSLSHWMDRPLDEGGLRSLKGQIQPQHLTVMISAKSRTPVDTIRRVFMDSHA